MTSVKLHATSFFLHNPVSIFSFFYRINFHSSAAEDTSFVGTYFFNFRFSATNLFHFQILTYITLKLMVKLGWYMICSMIGLFVRVHGCVTGWLVRKEHAWLLGLVVG